MGDAAFGISIQLPKAITTLLYAHIFLAFLFRYAIPTGVYEIFWNGLMDSRIGYTDRYIKLIELKDCVKLLTVNPL